MEVATVVKPKKFVIETENATIQVDPSRSELVEMKRIDGRRHVLVAVEGEVTVNGVKSTFCNDCYPSEKAKNCLSPSNGTDCKSMPPAGDQYFDTVPSWKARKSGQFSCRPLFLAQLLQLLKHICNTVQPGSIQ